MSKPRVLSLLLALVMCLSLLPTSALAVWAAINPDTQQREEFDDPREIPEGYIVIGQEGGEDEEDAPKGPFTITFLIPDSENVVKTTNKDGQVTAPSEPSKEGFTFKCWKYGSEEYTSDEIENITFESNATIAAVIEKVQDPMNVILTFDPNGGTINGKTGRITVKVNPNTGKPDGGLPEPERNGYYFRGWCQEGHLNDGYTYDDFNTFTIDLTLVAKWEKRPEPAAGVHEIWFHLEGGTVTSVAGVKVGPRSGDYLQVNDKDNHLLYCERPDDGEEILGEMMSNDKGLLLGLPVIEKKGYDFDGWYNAPTGGKKIEADHVFKGEGQWGRDYLWARWTPSETFTVKFNLNGGGGRVPDSLEVMPDSKITLPKLDEITAPEGMKFAYWGYVTEKDGYALHRWNEAEDEVKGDLTLYAGWIPKNGSSAPPTVSASKPETEAPASFKDVADNSPFKDAISWAVAQKITNGTGDGSTFSPGATCTRGQILTFLWRSQGSPEPTINNPYIDTIPDAFLKAAVWAHEKGLITGDTFGVATPCTRASSVTYMWLLAGSPEAKAASFTDVETDSDYAKAISWAVEQGVTNGTGDGSTFSPETTCTRGQIVTFLYRAYAKK